MKWFSDASKVIVFLLALALPAVAQKPTITAAPFQFELDPAGQGCEFGVLLTPEPDRPNGGRTIEFANSVIIQGPLFVTATNLSSGKTINLNLSGPGTIFFTTNTSVAKGPQFAFMAKDVAAAAGLPSPVLIFYGRAVFALDDQGNITSVISITGTVQDLCQLLQ